MNHCAFCGSPFEPSSVVHRYCRPACRDADHNRHRLELVRAERERQQAQGGTTYSAWAQAEAEMTAGGRFGALSRAAVAVNAPPILPLPQHLIDPSGDEGPLGYAIDDMGDRK